MHLQCKHFPPHASCSPFREDFPESIGEELSYLPYVIHLELILTMDTTLSPSLVPTWNSWAQSFNRYQRRANATLFSLFSHLHHHTSASDFLEVSGVVQRSTDGKKGHTLSVRCSDPRGLILRKMPLQRNHLGVHPVSLLTAISPQAHPPSHSSPQGSIPLCPICSVWSADLQSLLVQTAPPDPSPAISLWYVALCQVPRFWWLIKG